MANPTFIPFYGWPSSYIETHKKHTQLSLAQLSLAQQRSGTQRSAVQRRAVPCPALRCGAVPCCAVVCRAVPWCAVPCRAVLSVSFIPEVCTCTYTCMWRPVCFRGAWSYWHLHVACLHLKCWILYHICHSAPFFLVSERGGWNRLLREAPCITGTWYILRSIIVPECLLTLFPSAATVREQYCTAIVLVVYYYT